MTEETEPGALEGGTIGAVAGFGEEGGGFGREVDVVVDDEAGTVTTVEESNSVTSAAFSFAESVTATGEEEEGTSGVV